MQELDIVERSDYEELQHQVQHLEDKVNELEDTVRELLRRNPV